MENPFEIILERLDRIEKAIEKLSANGPLAHTNDPMDVKDLSAYLKISASAIYKFTAEGSIPHYKNGKRLFFKREEIIKRNTKNNLIIPLNLLTPSKLIKLLSDLTICG